MSNAQDIETVIQSMLSKLIADYHPQQVILFGSHVYGEPDLAKE